jgi:hypothetical protein
VARATSTASLAHLQAQLGLASEPCNGVCSRS